ncbi:fasciclin domain-containing protein [Streptomyces sp. x-19]|uniref:fasciclin domain-containing protein n=1 Tax=Streptomyces sp. x-19 TaxID=2789280 RepID=UPI0039805ED5
MSTHRIRTALTIATATALPLCWAAAATPAAASPTADTVGSQCSALPHSGPGSAQSLADKPVVTGAEQNSSLSTLVTALKKAGLVDTLNHGKHLTVFAPTNKAFSKISKADLAKLLGNKQELKKVLTYHVVGEQITPKQFPNGKFKTLEGGELTTQVSGSTYTVNNTAQVTCGNLKAANATVYLIDHVLTPPK